MFHDDHVNYSSYSHRVNSLTLALPVPGTELIQAFRYAHSIGSTVAKLEVQLPDTTRKDYFLKVSYHINSMVAVT